MGATLPHVVLVLVFAGGSACRCDSPREIAVLYADGGTGWVNTANLIAGPIQHQGLTDQQTARIAALQRTFADVDDSSFQKWIDDFKHDANVDRELTVYEHIASAYADYIAANPALGQPARREVYSLLVMRSQATEAETVARTKLRALDAKEVRDVLRRYKEPPHPIRVIVK
jgi:hypothetical protein